MKLLMIQHHYYPSLGGGQEYAKLLSEGLAKKKHKVTVYTTNSLTNEDILSLEFKPPFLSRKIIIQPLRDKEVINGVEIERFKVSWRFYSFNFIPSLSRQLKDLNKFDVVTAYGFNLLTSFIACFQAKRQHKPFVLNGVDVLMPQNFPLLAKIMKWFYDKTFAKYVTKNSHLIISFTNDHVKEYVKRGADKSQMKVIPPPLVLKDYSSKVPKSFKKKYNIKEGDRIISYVGRITEHKGIQDIINILPKINKRVPDVKFFIVGEDYGYKKELEQLIRENSVFNQVFFAGPFKAREKELIHFFAVSDLFVLPSNMEGFGIVLVEAMACGTPCVAYDISAVREVVQNGKNGYLVNSKDEMKDKIINMLSDRESLNKMSGYCKGYVKQFSQERVLDKLEKIYKETLNRWRVR